MPTTVPAPPTAAPLTPPTHAALSDSARRFLRPLVGIDADSVRVVRGPAAHEATSEVGADALTVGNVVALGQGHEADSPETLGLLAHELTHVARGRSPRFVPPIAREAQSTETSALPGFPARMSAQAGVHEPPEVSAWPSQATDAVSERSADQQEGEETIAELVERRVIAEARRVAEGDGETASPRSLSAYRSGAADERAASRHESEAPSRDVATWGGLPAPWEPMPSWPAEAAGTSVGPVVAPQPAATGTAVTADAPSFAASVQRAELGRSLPEEVDGGPGHQGPTAPEPDLDALARQVYEMLKRRLAAERRRGL